MPSVSELLEWGSSFLEEEEEEKDLRFHPLDEIKSWAEKVEPPPQRKAVVSTTDVAPGEPFQAPRQKSIDVDEVQFDSLEEAVLYNASGLDKQSDWERADLYITGRIPFSPTTALYYEGIREAGKRYGRGQASNDDLRRLAEFVNAASRHKKESWGKWTVDIMSQLPAYGIEFAATGGIYRAGKALGMKGAEKILGKAAERGAGRLAAGAAARTAGVAAQTLAIPTMPAENVMARLASGKDESFAKSLSYGVLDAMIELGTERAGGRMTGLGKWLGGMAGKAADKTPLVNGIKRAVVNRYFARGGTVEGANAILKKAGFNGFWPELGEERLGEILRGAIPGMSEEGFGVTGELAGIAALKAPDIEALKQLTAEAAAFAPLSLIGAAGGGGLGARRRAAIESAAAKLEAGEPPSRTEARDAGAPEPEVRGAPERTQWFKEHLADLQEAENARDEAADQIAGMPFEEFAKRFYAPQSEKEPWYDYANEEKGVGLTLDQVYRYARRRSEGPADVRKAQEEQMWLRREVEKAWEAKRGQEEGHKASEVEGMYEERAKQEAEQAVREGPWQAPEAAPPIDVVPPRAGGPVQPLPGRGVVQSGRPPAPVQPTAPAAPSGRPPSPAEAEQPVPPAAGPVVPAAAGAPAEEAPAAPTAAQVQEEAERRQLWEMIPPEVRAIEDLDVLEMAAVTLGVRKKDLPKKKAVKSDTERRKQIFDLIVKTPSFKQAKEGREKGEKKLAAAGPAAEPPAEAPKPEPPAKSMGVKRPAPFQLSQKWQDVPQGFEIPEGADRRVDPKTKRQQARLGPGQRKSMGVRERVRRSPVANVREWAEDRGLNPDHALESARDIVAREANLAIYEIPTAEAKRYAHDLTGLQHKTMEKYRNRGDKGQGSIDFAKIPNFDVDANRVADQYPNVFVDEQDIPQAVWTLLELPMSFVDDIPSIDSKKILDQVEKELISAKIAEEQPRAEDLPFTQDEMDDLVPFDVPFELQGGQDVIAPAEEEKPELPSGVNSLPGQRDIFGNVTSEEDAAKQAKEAKRRAEEEKKGPAPIRQKPKEGHAGDWDQGKLFPGVGKRSLFGEESAAERAQREAEESREDVEGRGFFGGGKYKGGPARDEEVPVEYQAETEEIEQAILDVHGMGSESLLDKIRRWKRAFINSLTRAELHLPNTPRFAVAREFFRLLRAVPQAQSDEAIRRVASITNPLNRTQMILFERFVLVRNQLAALEAGQPFRHRFETIGKDGVQRYHDRLKRLADADPVVKKALETRLAIVTEIVQNAIKYNLLPAETINNVEAYYHQQVAMYWNARGRIATGTRAGKVRRPFQKARVEGDVLGAEYDPNTSYIESEATWMTDALMEVEKEKLLIEMLMPEYDIRAELNRESKRLNFERLVGGPANVAQINELRGLIRESWESEDRHESYARQQRAAWIEELEGLDPTHAAFRRPIAQMAAKLRAELGLDSEDGGEYSEEETGWWDIVKRETSQNNPLALGIFKKLHQREQFIAGELGPKFLTWQKMAKQKEGYTPFQPEPGTLFYRAFTLPERIVSLIQSEAVKSAEITKEDLRDVMAVAGPRRQFVVPVELADQLDATKKILPDELRNLADTAMRSWKIYRLLYPKGIIPYNVRNWTGDLEPVVASNPVFLKHVPEAFKLLREYYGDRIYLPQILKLARDLNVIGAGFTAQEIPDLKEAEVFTRFFEQQPKTRFIRKPVSSYFNTVKKYTQFREDLLRLAVFMGYLEQVKKGKISNYGGARKATVDQLRTRVSPEVAAGHLARNLIGDYGNVTVAGDWIRRRLMPFWSFQEINLKRNPRLAINAWEAGMGDLARFGALKAATITAYSLAMLSWMYGAAWVWNNLVRPPDEEEDLGDYDKANLHVNLGRNPDGSVRVFRRVGALQEFLEWFGVNELFGMMRQYGEGQITPREILQEMAFSPAEKGFESLRPDLKALYEVGTGQSLFPEFRKPRAVRRGEALANPFGLVDEWKETRGRILDTGERARPHYWQRWFVGVVDPKASALSRMYDRRNQFLKKKGSPEEGTYPISQYKEARDAAKNEDFDAFVEWKRAFVEKEGAEHAWKKFKEWLPSLDPIANRLNNKDEVEFEQKFLSTDERQDLRVSRDFARELQDRLVGWWDAAERSGDTTMKEDVIGSLTYSIAKTAKPYLRMDQEDQVTVRQAIARLKSMGVDQAEAQQILYRRLRREGMTADGARNWKKRLANRLRKVESD